MRPRIRDWFWRWFSRTDWTVPAMYSLAKTEWIAEKAYRAGFKAGRAHKVKH
jgi:hypothetical protein